MILATCPFGTGRFAPFNKSGIFHAFRDLTTMDAKLTKDDCLIVWGGADISPALYKKKLSSKTWAEPIPSHRDQFEWHFMNQAAAIGIPIIGICRGAQMLCALAGGHLIQDVDNHGRSHKVDTFDGKKLEVSSVHHQMMYPWNVKHQMVAWSSHKLSRIDKGGNVVYNYTDVNADGEDIQVEVPCEPEFVYFPEVKGFAIQWHPEFMDDDAEATQYIFQFMKEKIGVQTEA